MRWIVAWLVLVTITGLANLILQTPDLQVAITPLNVTLLIIIIGLVAIPAGRPVRRY